jgi:uncharacterized protein (DUF885 family)
MGNFLEKEYLPKARETDGYNSLPNGKEIYNIMQKAGQQPIKRRKKLIKSDFSR